MRTFIQLRDGIGYATVITSEMPDHSITPDHTTIVEVFTDNPEQFIKKIYNKDTQTWSDAPVFRFAELNETGQITEIKRTVFIHEILEGMVQLPAEANAQWKFIDNEWVAPTVAVQVAVDQEQL